MSVIVKGMKMPSECARVEDGEFVHCPFVNTDDDCILQSKVTVSWEDMYQNCPLVALPDHHGRLGDLDALEKEGWSLHRTIQVDKYTSEYQTKPLKQVPTIVEAEGEDANHE